MLTFGAGAGCAKSWMTVLNSTRKVMRWALACIMITSWFAAAPLLSLVARWLKGAVENFRQKRGFRRALFDFAPVAGSYSAHESWHFERRFRRENQRVPCRQREKELRCWLPGKAGSRCRRNF